MRSLRRLAAALLAASVLATAARAETIRVAVGTQDTTINCATGGLLLRAVRAQGWDPERDVTIITRAPEVAGSALKANKIEAHADFVPLAELFPWRGIARTIYDGSQSNAPTFHGSLVDAAYAERYPEIVTAYLRAAIEADRLVAAEPQHYAELIERVTGIAAEVAYLFHGPLGLQTRDITWKPEYRQALKTSIETLTLLKKTDGDLSVDRFIGDRFVRAAAEAAGLDYETARSGGVKSALGDWRPR